MALISEELVFPWVEKVLGQKIVSFVRQGGRESGGRPGWFITVEDGERFYARSCRDEDWGFTAKYGLQREGGVLDILYAEGIKVPKILARSEHPPVLLMEYVEGENDFTLIDDPKERDQVATDFSKIMAQWHAIDATAFESLGMNVPSTDEDYVLNDLKVWEEGCFPFLKEPVPLLTFACKWLRENIPPAPERPVLVQGDTGPGQFLFADGKVKSVIDWELAFLGDPMRELAQIRTRDVWYPTGNLMHWFNEYSRASGVPLDYDKLRYYNVIAMLITTMALSPYVQQPNPSDDHAEWYSQDAWSKLASAEALAEAMSIQVEAPLIPEPRESRHAKLYDILDQNLREEQLPKIETIENGFLAHRLNMDLRLIAYMKRIEEIGDEIDKQEISDMSELLGYQPANRGEGMKALDALVVASGPEKNEVFVRYFYRHGMREVALMKGALGRAEHASTTALS